MTDGKPTTATITRDGALVELWFTPSEPPRWHVIARTADGLRFAEFHKRENDARAAYLSLVAAHGGAA